MKDEERDGTEINALELLGVDPDIRELASLERLRLAAKVAPSVRGMTEKQRARKVRQEGGGTTTVGEIVDTFCDRNKIEFSVWPSGPSGPSAQARVRALARHGLSNREIVALMGPSAPSRATVARLVLATIGRQRAERGAVRPAPHGASRDRRAKFLATPCAGGCDRLPPASAARQKNPKAWKCARCAKGRPRVSPTGPCAGYEAPCDAMPTKNSVQPTDGPWRCRPCATRRAQASLSGDALARARGGYKNWWTSLSEEQRQAERAKRAKPRKAKP